MVENRSKSGITTTYAYDALGRRTGVNDPRTGTTVTHYDADGRVDYVQDGAGHRTRFGYDPQTGRRTSQTDALDKVTRYAYNPGGQVTRTWGDEPYPVQYIYDDYGRMSAMHTYRTQEGFDGESFPEAAAGDTTLWHYDEATGLLEAKEYADGSRVSYTYTTGSRLQTRTWARQDSGQPLVTTYNYDPGTGELTMIDYSDATADISFVYDRLGRQAEIGDALGTHSYGYNPALQLESETVTGLYDAVITRTYDTTGVAGRPSGFNLGAGYSVGYSYGPATGRFETLTWNADGQSDTATYTYVPDSDLLQGYSTTSGLQTTYGYEPQRNLKTSVQNSFNGTLVSQYDYRYDPVGRRTSAANTGPAFAQAAFSAYGYNDRSELIAADRYLGTDVANQTNPVPAEQRGYLYDPIGNRTRAVTAGAPVNYSANALNQYTDIAGIVPAYDPDGNLVAGPDDMTYTYNAENRLIAAQPAAPAEGDSRVEFTYDYMGRRVQKVVYSYSSGAWVQNKEILFVYDGWNLVKETTTPDGGSSVDKYYVWGLDLSQSLQGAGGVGGLLAVIDGSLTYQYLYDGNGNVGQLVDAADGSIAARYEYDPYGNLTDLGGAYADANAYRFSTKFFDGETNLYFFGLRYYSPELGRWLTKDPTEEKGGLNLYGFCNNDGIGNIDYLGEFPSVGELYKKVLSVFKALGSRAIKALAMSDEILKHANANGVALEAGVILTTPFPSGMIGVNAMFFPESCEIASYRYLSGFLAAILGQVEKKDQPDFFKNPLELLRGASIGKSASASISYVVGIPVNGGQHDADTWRGWFWDGELNLPANIGISAFGGMPVNGENKWYGAAIGYGISGGKGGVLATYYSYLWSSYENSVIPLGKQFKEYPCLCKIMRAINFVDPIKMSVIVESVAGVQSAKNAINLLF